MHQHQVNWLCALLAQVPLPGESRNLREMRVFGSLATQICWRACRDRSGSDVQ
jgi:hypothetical protein